MRRSPSVLSVRGAVFEKEKLSRRKPGALHHVAFMVDDTQTVDRLYEQVLQMKMQIVHAPRFYPEYCEDYDAFFLKDSEGIELEITCYDRQKYFPYISGDTENSRHGS